MKVYCFASSSSGNCYILDFDIGGVSTQIMVECGIPLPSIISSCNDYKLQLSKTKACLITHAHGDHCKSAKKLNDLSMPIFASKPTLNKIGIKGNELKINEPNKVIDGLYVLPFDVEHDIDGAVGFVIKTKTECVIFVNDCKRWTTDLRNFKPNYVFIECNYDHKMVYAQYHELKSIIENNILSEQELKEANIKISQHERNMNAHMSLAGTIKGLDKLNLSKCSNIFLMHMSDRYANEYKMKNEIQMHTGIKTFAMSKHGGIK